MTWDKAALERLEVPLSHSAFSPKHISPDYYYQIPVRPIFRAYPVYAPMREPAGYFESLLEKEPEEVQIDHNQVRNDSDWIALSEIVFQAPTCYDCFVIPEDVRSPDWYERTGTLIAADGTVPFVAYVVRERGKVELGIFSCAYCHTRVMPDGSVIRGAQGNLPFDRIWAYWMRKRGTAAGLLSTHVTLYGNPWEADPASSFHYRSGTSGFPPSGVAHLLLIPYELSRFRTKCFGQVILLDVFDT